MNNKTTTYRNASVIMAGLASLIMIVCGLSLINIPFDTKTTYWIMAVNSLVLPIFCFWLGGLIRSIWQAPPMWCKLLLVAIVPVMYAILTFCPSWSWRTYFYWPSGYDMLLLTLVIIGFFALPEARSESGKGWLSLVLFLALAYCFVGIEKVSDHFIMANYTLRDSEWTKLFTRSIRVIPLTVSLFFLQRFSMSDLGQKIGGVKWLRWLAVALVVFAGVIVYAQVFECGFRWFKVRLVLTQPLTVMLIYGVCVGTRKMIKKYDGKR